MSELFVVGSDPKQDEDVIPIVDTVKEQLMEHKGVQKDRDEFRRTCIAAIRSAIKNGNHIADVGVMSVKHPAAVILVIKELNDAGYQTQTAQNGRLLIGITLA